MDGAKDANIFCLGTRDCELNVTIDHASFLEFDGHDRRVVNLLRALQALVKQSQRALGGDCDLVIENLKKILHADHSMDRQSEYFLDMQFIDHDLISK